MGENKKDLYTKTTYAAMGLAVAILISFLIPQKEPIENKKEPMNIEKIKEKSKSITEEDNKKEKERLDELIEGKESKKPLILTIADDDKIKIVKANAEGLDDKVDNIIIDKDNFLEIFEEIDFIDKDLIKEINSNKVSNIVYNRKNEMPEKDLSVYSGIGFFIACKEDEDVALLSHSLINKDNYKKLYQALLQDI